DAVVRPGRRRPDDELDVAVGLPVGRLGVSVAAGNQQGKKPGDDAGAAMGGSHVLPDCELHAIEFYFAWEPAALSGLPYRTTMIITCPRCGHHGLHSPSLIYVKQGGCVRTYCQHERIAIDKDENMKSRIGILGLGLSLLGVPGL